MIEFWQQNNKTQGNEWKIYDYVTRHFIATLHDEMKYVERALMVDIGGHRNKLFKRKFYSF